MTDDWESRVSAVWANADTFGDDEVLGQIDTLVAERDEDDPAALFESASARDYVGLEDQAEPLYRRAIDAGLDEPRLGQAAIQLASTLRNLGKHDEALEVLESHFGTGAEHPLDDAARAFLALILSSKGEERAALSVALGALARHLPAYQSSVRSYAAELLD